MAIRDIFRMIKADRYTQDGREELIKAQEAITEDIRYKPGDISKATGLQKQPDGSWKPVKNAPAQSKKQAAGTGLKPGALEEMAKEVDSPEARQNYDDFMKAYKERERREISGDPALSASGSGDNPYVMSEAEKEKAMKDPRTNLSQKYDAVKNAKKGTPEYEKALNDYTEAREEFKTSQGADAVKEFPILPESGSETVTKMSDLVAQKSRPESAPTGRQPTPEMLEREKMRKSPEAKARSDLRESLYPRTETGAPKPSTPQSTIIGNLSSEDKNKIYQLFNDADFRRQLDNKLEFGLDNQVGELILKKLPHGELKSKVYNLADQYNRENFSDAREYKSGLTEKAMGQLYKDYKEGKTSDSAPRILTGDCKVRIKKSK